MALLKDNLRFRLLFAADVFLLLLVIVLQATYLDYLLLKLPEDYGHLFLFIFIDLIIITMFIVTFIRSYHHFSQKEDDFLDGKSRFIPAWWKRGTLPMSYFVWYLYINGLLVKLLVLCFKYDLSKENPQIIQVCLAVSTIVFMLLVEGHNWHKKSSESYSFITGVCKKNGIEIFDSVEILELFFTPNKVTRPIQIIVFCLAAFNFYLPTLSLYRLSLSNFGTENTKASLPLKILHNVLRFIFIDIPFFVIRLNIWIIHRDLSMFMMKNVFNMIMSIRELYVDICSYFKPVKPDNELTLEDVPLTTPTKEEETQTGVVKSDSCVQ